MYQMLLKNVTDISKESHTKLKNSNGTFSQCLKANLPYFLHPWSGISFPLPSRSKEYFCCEDISFMLIARA